MVDDVDHEVSKSDVRAGEERRWPAWVALFSAGFAPATTARRTDHVSLLKAFGVHLLSAAVVGFLVCCMVARLEGRSVVLLASELAEDALHELAASPGIVVLLALVSVVVVEGVFLVGALLLCSWGARDELVRSSFAASLRRTWIQTSQAILVTLVICVPAVLLSDAWKEWYSDWSASLPEYPVTPKSPAANATTEEVEAYNAEMETFTKEAETYWAEWNKSREKRPWWVKHNDEIMIAVVLVAAVWWLLALLRSVGTRREVEPRERAPMCEHCGYNLTGASLDGACSECGERVAASLGPFSQRKSPWERRKESGVVRSWARSAIDAVFRPVGLGRQLSVGRWTSDHRVFLLPPIAGVWLLTCVGMPLCYYGAEGRNPFVSEPEVVWAVGPLLGVSLAVALFGGALFVALVTGIWYLRLDGRNLLPAAIQAVSYLGGFLFLWVLLNCLYGPLVLATLRWKTWRGWESLTGMDEEALAFVTWLIPNAILAVLFLERSLRITSGARYANS